MLIDAAHGEETRVVVLDGNTIEEFDFESESRRPLTGNIYLAKVTRVEPSLQAAFVEYGGNRHGFLAYSEIHPDYYQIPIEDREALMAEEEAEAEASGTETDNNDLDTGDTGADDIGLGINGEGDAAAAVEEATAVRAMRKPVPRPYKIQEVIKVRQILLVQVIKEERGTKGAALTTYLSLPGRYCVLMPNTSRGGGISRKIINADDRNKLREIASEIKVPKGAGLIVRTAGAKRTKVEIKRDYEYLQRLWEQIRELTLKSIAPAQIYVEGDLIKRSIRDLYSREIEEVLVEGETGYRVAKDFMKMIMPSHAKNVKQYSDSLPLFTRYRAESYLEGMFSPVVQLKSGGYIVIGVTEALVAIDVNSGKSTKEASVEGTALKTNLEAADEVARQLRLRDLSGLIVIDFIDMSERKNRTAVEKRMQDRLRADRARTQTGKISDFGLLEMSRQRVRRGMLEATTKPCATCGGTGLIRSDQNLGLSILRRIEEEGLHRRTKEVTVRCPVAVANYLLNSKREFIGDIESRFGLLVRIEGNSLLANMEFEVEMGETSKARASDAAESIVSPDSSFVDTETGADPARDATPTGESKPKRRRRRRRRSGSTDDQSAGSSAEATKSPETTEGGSDPAEGSDPASGGDAPSEEEGRPKRRRRARGRRRASRATESPRGTLDAASPAAGESVDLQVDSVGNGVDTAMDVSSAQPAVAETTVSPEVSSVMDEKSGSSGKPDRSNSAEPATSGDSLKTLSEAKDGSQERLLSETESGPVSGKQSAQDSDSVSIPGEVISSEPGKPKRRGWWVSGG